MSFGEGIRELQPDSLISGAGLYISNEINGDYTRFGVINCEPNYRLCIHVKEAGESILFGLQTPLSYYTYQFNLRKPDGTVVLSGNCPQEGQQGYIRYYGQAIVGPFPSLGGYTPLQYTASSAADTGNYYFEISNLSTVQSVIFDYWDFQVVSGEHTPAVPEDMIMGRVWSQAWQVYANLGYPVQEFNGRFYVYSNDSIVTKLEFQNTRIGAVTVFCNPFGCYNTGNFLADRQSVNTNTFLTFPGIADYRVFLNDPDTTVFESGSYGEILGTPVMVPDTSFPPCSGAQLVLVNVTKSGNVDVTITFPYGFPATTVNLFSAVTPGVNQIPWNGLDGLGNPVPDATLLTITVAFANGLTNLPVWDQETNPDGFVISLVRPASASGQIPKTYWDDRALTGYSLCPVAPQTFNLSGCTPGSIPGYQGCHPWGLGEPDCHNKMINTWWYGSSSTSTFTEIFYSTPPVPVGHGDTRCGPGMVTLHATVPSTSTVDWYDVSSGGIPVLSGDTTLVTPVVITTTFYAEARNEVSQCTNPVRVPVVATVLPAPIPLITGPDHVCSGTPGNMYQTDPGKSNYEWWLSSGGLITSPNGNSTITVTWIEPGQHAVFVNYMDPNGCPATDPAAFRVLVSPLPDSAGIVSGPSPVCAGTEGVIYSLEPVLWTQNYEWSLPPGFTIISGEGTNVITVNVSSGALSGDITVFGTNPCGNGFPSLPLPVTVTYPPVATAGPGDTICEGTPYTVVGAAASGYSSLLWISNGTGILENSGSLTPTYIPAAEETGMILLILIAVNPPCEADSSSLALWIEPQTQANAGPDQTTCYITPVFLEGSGATNYESLSWSTSGSGSFDDPASLHPHYIPDTVDWNNGFVTLTLTVLAKAPCTDRSDELQVVFSSPPTGSAGPDGNVCAGNSFRVTGARAEKFSVLQWSHNGIGSLEGTGTLSPEYITATNENGEVTLTLNIFGEGACADSVAVSSMMIEVFALEVEAGPDQEVDSGSVVLLSGMAGSGSGDYEATWEPAGFVTFPSSLETTTFPVISDTWFTLSVSDRGSGCSKSDSLFIHVILPDPPPPPPPDPECLKIYNVITPNGDGKNDTWIIDCIEQYPVNTVQILNRWGDRIRSFDSYDNINQVWDATNQRGEKVTDGTYYYIINIPGLATKTGWVFVR